jgi:hypothetical protein
MRHYRGIFQSTKHEFIQNFVSRQSPNFREIFGQVVRSLHTLRRASTYNTTAGVGYALNEDRRFWQPRKATPAKSLYELFTSKIPLGTLASTIKQILEETENQKKEETAPRAETPLSDAASEVTATDASHVTLELMH